MPNLHHAPRAPVVTGPASSMWPTGPLISKLAPNWLTNVKVIDLTFSGDRPFSQNWLSNHMASQILLGAQVFVPQITLIFLSLNLYNSGTRRDIEKW